MREEHTEFEWANRRPLHTHSCPLNRGDSDKVPSSVVYTTDGEGRAVSLGGAVESTFGCSLVDLQGRYLAARVHPDDRAAIVKLMAKTGNSGDSFCRFVTRFVLPSGDVRLLSWCGRPGGGAKECTGVIRDVTQEVAETMYRKEMLVQTEKLVALGEIISGVAHELNNPLTSVLGFAELLAHKYPGDRNLSYINTAAQRCRDIINNMISFIRKRDVQYHYRCINPIIEQTLKFITYLPFTEDVTIEKDLVPDLPRTMINPPQMNQVILNLVTNAHQAIREAESCGKIMIATGLHHGVIRIEVRDDGTGILPERRDKIFEPFYTTKPPGKGTGLGLSLSKRIIENHGGRLWVDSIPGEGASFFIELPVRTPRKAAPKSDARAERHSERELSILVIDDEPMVCELLDYMLGADGHTVTTFTSAKEACKEFLANDYDVVLCDFQMPEMSGREVFEFLYNLKPSLAERVIFLTGDSINRQTEDFLRGLNREWLAKPFAAAQVRRVINSRVQAIRKKS